MELRGLLQEGAPEKWSREMHINSVFVNGFWCHYNIESINGVVQITVRFVKDGQEIKKYYGVNSAGATRAETVAKLLDDEFAKKKAKDLIDSANRSAHSPFKEIRH